jgi:flavin-dependent dehydrogenase
MVNTLRYDLIVVGAGPAGSAAAIRGAASGLSVLLLEAQSFPRYRPGETLHPGIETLFKELGLMGEIVARDFNRHSGIFQFENGEKLFTAYNNKKYEVPWKGWIIPRDEMDTIFLDRAIRAGARFRKTRGHLRLIRDENFSLQVDGEWLSAGYILDATGDRFWLSRELNHPVIRYSDDLICFYGKCAGNFSRADNAPCFFRAENHWTWIAKLKPDLYQWTHLNYDAGTSLPEKNWRPDILRAMEPVTKTRSRDCSWRISAEPAGENFFCIGDAAFVTDPSSSQGVLKAVMTGIMAAHLAAEVLIAKFRERSSAAAEYNHWIRQWFSHERNNLIRKELIIY